MRKYLVISFTFLLIFYSSLLNHKLYANHQETYLSFGYIIGEVSHTKIETLNYCASYHYFPVDFIGIGCNTIFAHYKENNNYNKEKYKGNLFSVNPNISLILPFKVSINSILSPLILLPCYWYPFLNFGVGMIHLSNIENGANNDNDQMTTYNYYFEFSFLRFKLKKVNFGLTYLGQYVISKKKNNDIKYPNLLNSINFVIGYEF